MRLLIIYVLLILIVDTFCWSSSRRMPATSHISNPANFTPPSWRPSNSCTGSRASRSNSAMCTSRFATKKPASTFCGPDAGPTSWCATPFDPWSKSAHTPSKLTSFTCPARSALRRNDFWSTIADRCWRCWPAAGRKMSGRKSVWPWPVCWQWRESRRWTRPWRPIDFCHT